MVGNWTYAATKEIVNQFQKYVKDTYGVDIKLTYVGTQAPSEYLTKLCGCQQGREPGSLRRHRGRGELLVRRDRARTSGRLPAVRPDPEPEARPRFVPARADVDRVPVDGLSRRRLQQEERAVPQDAQGPRRPAPQGQGHPARAGRHHGRRVPARRRRRAGQGLQGSGPDEGSRRLGGRPTSTRTSSSTRRTSRRCRSCWSPGPSTRSASGTASPVSSTSAAIRTPRCCVPPTIYPANGYLWIPKKAPHPVLAQIFINWRLSPEVQFPNAWPIDHGQWSELSEGLPRPGLRGSRARLVQGRLLHLLPDPRPDQVARSSRSTGRPTTRARRCSRSTTSRRSDSRIGASAASPIDGWPARRGGAARDVRRSDHGR